MPTETMPQDTEVGQAGPADKLANDGDVLGLLAWLRSRSVMRLPPSAMDNLAKAIRTLERNDVNGLVEVAFGEIIGLVTVLLIRAQLHIERRLAEADSHDGNPVHLPQDLIDEDWVGRVERITKFLMEVTSTRERVRHLARLNTNAKRNPINFNWLDNRSPMDADFDQDQDGEGMPGNGRLRCQEGRIKFT